MLEDLKPKTKIALGCIIAAKFFGLMSAVALFVCMADSKFRLLAFACGGLWLAFLIASIGFAILSHYDKVEKDERELYNELKRKYG